MNFIYKTSTGCIYISIHIIIPFIAKNESRLAYKKEISFNSTYILYKKGCIYMLAL